MDATKIFTAVNGKMTDLKLLKDQNYLYSKLKNKMEFQKSKDQASTIMLILKNYKPPLQSSSLLDQLCNTKLNASQIRGRCMTSCLRILKGMVRGSISLGIKLLNGQRQLWQLFSLILLLLVHLLVYPFHILRW